ncbi:MAG TPA: type II secretion system F family protein [Bacillota bacterium]|nr:type II secretion system F family protein [Bacillota bacterium]
MVETAIILTFISVSCLAYSIIQGVTGRDRQIKTRLERLKPVLPIYSQTDNSLDQPFISRILGPFFNKIAQVALRLTPQNIRKRTELLLDQAGNPANLGVNEFLVLKTMIRLGLPLVTFLIVRPSNKVGFLLVGAVLIIAMILPDMILKRMVQKRRETIAAELPDTLDLLTVSVEAGLGFDQALLKQVEKTKGPLSQEFKRVLHEIRIGTTRRDALRSMAERTAVEDLQTFVAAVIQADQLGVSIGNVLRIQSSQLRQKRRQRAEEKAQKAPVKMLIPMILFIFPSLFIILLGPGILQLIDNFMKM